VDKFSQQILGCNNLITISVLIYILLSLLVSGRVVHSWEAADVSRHAVCSTQYIVLIRLFRSQPVLGGRFSEIP
jgi:hypothetical protein